MATLSIVVLNRYARPMITPNYSEFPIYGHVWKLDQHDKKNFPKLRPEQRKMIASAISDTCPILRPALRYTFVDDGGKKRLIIFTLDLDNIR